MAITITNEGHILDKKLTVQQGGAAIVGATSILGNTGITGDLGVTGHFGLSGGMSAGGGFSAGGDSSFAGDVSIDGVMGTLNPVLIEPEDESPPLVLGEQAQGQWVEGFNADLLDGLDSTDFMQRATNGTVSAVHTFSPVSVGPAFNLGANAKGQWVDGLNADYLDGLHGSSFLKLATAQTVTVAHTFNPAVAGAPFALGANALGYVVSGFNADQLDGLHKTDFLQLATAQTVTARHTFNPSVAGAPFTLGANAQGHTVSGFDADTLDGNHASAFVTSGALSNYLALTGGTLSGDLNVPKLIIEGGAYTDWSIDTATSNLSILYGATQHLSIDSAGKMWGKEANFTSIVYASDVVTNHYSLNSGYGKFKKLYVGTSYGYENTIERNDSDFFVFRNSAGTQIAAFNGSYFITYSPTFKANDGGGDIYCRYLYGTVASIDTDDPKNDRWEILNSAKTVYKSHNLDEFHTSMKKSFRKEGKSADTTAYNVMDLLQIAVECISDLRAELDTLKGKA